MRPAAEHRAQRLLVGPAPRRHQRRGSARPGRARRGRRRARAGGRPTARSGWRRRPGRRRRPAGSRRRPAASRRGRCAGPAAGKCPCAIIWVRSAGGLQVGQLQPAGGADAEQVGVAGDHRDHPAAAPHRDRLDPHRHVVAPLGVALADQPALVRTPRRAAAAARPARRCRPRRRRTPSGRSSAASGRPPRSPLPSRSGSHSTRSAKDRSAMICQSACSSCSHATSSSSRSVWLRTSSVERRHAVKRRRPTGRPGPAVRGRRFGRMGRHVRVVLAAGARRRPRGPHGPPARRPHRRADPDARVDPTRRCATGSPTRAGHLDRARASTTTCSPASATAWPPGSRVGLGERGTDTVFRRSFSALVLAECIARDNAPAAAARRQDPRVGRPARDLAAARARPARLRARQGLGARGRPRRRRARRARRARRTSARPSSPCCST